MHVFEKRNVFFTISIFIYLLLSIMSIYSASTYLSPTLGNLILKQAFWYLFGIIIIYLVSLIKRDLLYKYAWYFYIFNVFLLIFLLFFADPVNGSRSWFSLYGIISFQPSEFMKISLILMVGNIISFFIDKKKASLKNEFIMLILVGVVLFIPAVLTFLQPDTGIVIIYFIIVLAMLFVSGLRKRWFIGLGLLILSFLLVFLYIYYNNNSLFIDIFGSDFFYRIDRIINWNKGVGMQLNNSLAAIGSSGIIGHGFNNTPVYFPEAGTDFIFSVFASNFGLLGSFLLILFIIIFDLTIINVGKKCHRNKDKYIVAGICGILIYQQVQNIGMAIGLFPITGITLPLLSYGGSSLISYMILIGIIININTNYKKKKPLFHN